MKLKQGISLVALMLFLILIFINFSCDQSGKAINIIVEDKELRLPFYADKLYGQFSVNGKRVTIFSPDTTYDFIKFLNLTKYSVAIVDNVTYSFLKNVTDEWVKVCEVATKRPAIFKLAKYDNLSSTTFYALNVYLYRKLLKNYQNLVFVDNEEELFDKDSIFYRLPVEGYKVKREIGSLKFYLCVRKSSHFLNPEDLKGILTLWDNGVVYLKDPVTEEVVRKKFGVVKLKEVKYRFKNCL